MTGRKNKKSEAKKIQPERVQPERTTKNVKKSAAPTSPAILDDPPSGATSSGETNTWERGTTSSSETGTENQGSSAKEKEDSKVEIYRGGPDNSSDNQSGRTLIDRRTKKPGSVVSSNSARRRAEIEARMEVERHEMERAKAAAELARGRLELILLDEEDVAAHSDGDTELRTIRTFEWIRGSSHCYANNAPPQYVGENYATLGNPSQEGERRPPPTRYESPPPPPRRGSLPPTRNESASPPPRRRSSPLSLRHATTAARHMPPPTRYETPSPPRRGSPPQSRHVPPALRHAPTRRTQPSTRYESPPPPSRRGSPPPTRNESPRRDSPLLTRHTPPALRYAPAPPSRHASPRHMQLSRYEMPPPPRRGSPLSSRHASPPTRYELPPRRTQPTTRYESPPRRTQPATRYESPPPPRRSPPPPTHYKSPPPPRHWSPLSSRHASPPPRHQPDDKKNNMSAIADAIIYAVDSANQSNGARPYPRKPAPKYINELHPFDGNPSEWIAFKATYNDTEEYFSTIENVVRLRKAVQGQARDAVKSQLYTQSDPNEIVRALERRFGRPTYLIKNEVATLEKLPPMTEDGRNIASFAGAVANTVSTILQMNKPNFLHSSDMSEKIINKMSILVKFEWRKYFTAHEHEPILLSLRQFLNALADQMEAYEPHVEPAKTKKDFTKGNKPRAAKVHATTVDGDSHPSSGEESADGANPQATQFVAAAVQKEPEKPKCLLCEGDHTMKQCDKFIKASVQERWEMAKQAKVCFRCLKSKHRGFNCRAKPCGDGNCTRGHHKLLHADPEAPSEDKENKKVSSVNTICESKAYLKIAPVEITGPAGTARLYALLDEGSTVTLLEKEVADKIGASGPTEELNIEGIGGSRMKEACSRRLDVRIKGLYTRNYENLTAYTIDKLDLTPQAIRKKDIEDCSHLKDMICDLTYEQAKPALLIGQDNWHLIVSRAIKSGEPSKPVASHTKLGWVLHGCSSGAVKPIHTVNHMHRRGRDDELDSLMREHFSIESLGVAAKTPVNDPEVRALTLLDRTCKRLPEGRFEAGLLWKRDNEFMPESRPSALKRLLGIEKKMQKNATFKEEYTKHINNLINSGYAERIEKPPTTPRAWFLPHFAVVHPQKKKMRLVFDAAARSGGKCLNDALLPGPDLLQSLFGVLMRFREGPIAVVADIKEMFLRVKIREEDRDSLRFLWRVKEGQQPQEYRMTSLIFGATSSPCTAIYVKNKNAESFKREYPEAVKAVEKNHYMDDYLQSFRDEETARKIAAQVDEIHRAAGFELRGWASNYPAVIAGQSEAEENVEDISLGSQYDQIEKTLGLRWNVKQDSLNFALNLRNTPTEAIEGRRAPTKREATSAVMSVFDPLGLASPITIQGKMMLQNVWRTGIDWDQKLTSDEEIQWRGWLEDLRKLADINIPRCISSYATEGELHTFCDASEKAYASAVYWLTHSHGRAEVTLLAGKARVTPLKPVSIPRLELQASLLGCRLASSVEKELEGYNINSRTFWTDSRTVLAWIKSDPRTFKPYVAHRLAEIEDHTRPTEWRWVPTKHNVADDATRSAPPTFDRNHRWFTGPEFLYEKPEDWPEDKSAKETPVTGEEKCTVATVKKAIAYEFPAPERFSNWTRLLRAAARFLQSIDVFKSTLKTPNTVGNIKRTVKDGTWRKYSNRKTQRARQQHYRPKTERDSDTHRNLMPLSEEYLQKAELCLIRTIQRESFASDISRLKNEEKIDKNSPLRRLTLDLENEVIRLSTRVGAASYLPNDYKKPAVLNGKHRLTRLLIEEYHKKCNHGNHNTVMNEIRQKFYITSLRSIVRAVARQCIWCKLHKNTPQMAPLGDLPSERLQRNSFPFTFAAVDYFGPMQITVARRHEKRWGVLFTCLTTRAVHLELAASLSTDSMILALRRMAARRGSPKTIWSDNGTNFVGANHELKDEITKMKKECLTATAEARGITWKFIPPGAPHMGGSWERMVRSIKVALAATLKERYPKEEVLHTILLEAEHIVNSRPLTDVSLDPEDDESLTPNHFLIGRSNGAPDIGTFADDTLVGRATWRTAQRLTDHFWTRWTKEYLPTLSPRYYTGNDFTNPQPGDVVIIVDSSLPRCVWPRGEILTAHPGPDGRVRVVDVRTGAGVLRRPTSRLVIIAPKTGACCRNVASRENGASHQGGDC